MFEGVVCEMTAILSRPQCVKKIIHVNTFAKINNVIKFIFISNKPLDE